MSSAVENSRVYFGHQSVGGNILSGLPAVAPQLKVVELSAPDRLNGPAIYHSKIGKNRDCQSKIEAFEKVLNQAGEKTDVAMMKFCYVDVYPDTDVQSLFNNYVAMVERLQKKFPKLTLIHTTVPLTVHGGGLKKTIKNWLKGDQVNIARAKYNALIRSRFANEALFDIAQAEARRPDGSLETHNFGGQTFEAAWPQYTVGVGHLNETGAKHLAAEFVQAINRALTAKKS
jgi:hypothetical protein